MELLRQKAEQLNIELSETQLQQFHTYYEMLVEKNKVMNLTAITEHDEVIDKHFVDSIMLGHLVDLSQKKTVIDVGTGAGFPGIPLKIAFPNLQVTLLDSLNKRVLFLQDVIRELGLNGIDAIHSRAEDGARDKNHREAYDLCVSRAVANLSTLSEYCLPYVKKGGCFISYKAVQVEEELEQAKNAIHVLGGKLEKTEILQIPGSDIEREFIFIQKCLNTPKTYPRKSGTAAKNPL